MSYFIRFANYLSLLGVWLSAALLVYAVGHVLVDIVLRVGFGTSTHIMDEFVGYAVGAMTFLALAYAQSQKSLIRVNVLYAHLSVTGRRILEFFRLTLTSTAMLYLAYFIGRMVVRDWVRGRLSIGMAEIPMWIPQAVLWLGLVLFIIQLLASMVSVLMSDETCREPV